MYLLDENFKKCKLFFPLTIAEVCQMDQLTVINKNEKCHFCGSSKNDYLKYGPKYKIGNIKAHYYCVLLSNRLIQNGNDDQGMLGFLITDIQNELERTTHVLCFYCNKGYATISCAIKKCKKNFHLPCGLKFGSSHQFTNQFKSYCHNHQLTQNIPKKILIEAFKTEAICCICHEMVNIKKKNSFLWAPCCIKSWYHRICVQKLAHSSGYFFRCAACNDVKKFTDWMQKFGIFIPQQDASWELVPNAFEELLFRYSNCDAEVCKCPSGRQNSTENTLWEVILCDSCGSQGIHVGCGNLKFVDPEWECPECEKVTRKLKSSTEVNACFVPNESSSEVLNLGEVSQKKRRRGSKDQENSVLDKRKKFRTNVEEEEIYVDVETTDGDEKNDEAFAENKQDEYKEVGYAESWKGKTSSGSFPQEILTLLKPGPLSYKLSVIDRVYGTSRKEKQTNESQIDLIELNDSDNEIEVIEEMKMSSCHRVKQNGKICRSQVATGSIEA